MRINLKVERIKRGLTQQEMAKELGISQAAYSQYELGKVNPGLEKAEKIADFFNKDIKEIFLTQKTI